MQNKLLVELPATERQACAPLLRRLLFPKCSDSGAAMIVTAAVLEGRLGPLQGLIGTEDLRDVTKVCVRYWSGEGGTVRRQVVVYRLSAETPLRWDWDEVNRIVSVDTIAPELCEFMAKHGGGVSFELDR